MFEILIFAAKLFCVFVFLAALILLIAVLILRSSGSSRDLEVTPLHERWKNIGMMLKTFLLSKHDLKAEKKKLKKEKKEEAKEDDSPKSKTFVIRFEGDVKAHQVESLREEINAILQVATPQDEVVVVVHSPGGVVTGYGLAASQLLRIRSSGIPLTVCVDEIAASGGYLMACVANRILSAPFAIIGSIGVVAGIPNLHRLLKKFDVDYKEYTAGEFKRTVSFLGEITPKGEQKFLEQLEETHVLFKTFVQKFRPQIDISKVATGEYWYGDTALGLGLVDELKTSDDYLLEKAKNKGQIFEIKYEHKTPLSEKISEFLGKVLVGTTEKVQREVRDKSVHKVL